MRKVKVTRKVYGHNSFFYRMEPTAVKDDAEAKKKTQTFESLKNQKS